MCDTELKQPNPASPNPSLFRTLPASGKRSSWLRRVVLVILVIWAIGFCSIWLFRRYSMYGTWAALDQGGNVWKVKITRTEKGEYLVVKSYYASGFPVPLEYQYHLDLERNADGSYKGTGEETPSGERFPVTLRLRSGVLTCNSKSSTLDNWTAHRP